MERKSHLASMFKRICMRLRKPRLTEAEFCGTKLPHTLTDEEIVEDFTATMGKAPDEAVLNTLIITRALCRQSYEAGLRDGREGAA